MEGTGEGFVVGYDRKFLRRLAAVTGFFGLVMCPLALYIALFQAPSSTGAGKLFGPLMIVIAPFGFAMMALFLIWALRNMRTKAFAFVVQRDALTIGFGYFAPIRLPWEQISTVFTTPSPKPEMTMLCFDVVDRSAFLRSVGLLQRLISGLPGSATPLSISLAALDKPWEEINAALGQHIFVREAPPTAEQEAEDGEFKVMRARFEQNLAARTTLNGKLVTLEDYKRHFRHDLIGMWAPASVGFTYSPADQNIVFEANGTGGFTSGPLHQEVEFEWKRDSDYRILMRVRGGDFWVAVEYSFIEGEPPILRFGFDHDGEDDENVGEFDAILGDAFLFAGPPAGD